METLFISPYSVRARSHGCVKWGEVLNVNDFNLQESIKLVHTEEEGKEMGSQYICNKEINLANSIFDHVFMSP